MLHCEEPHNVAKRTPSPPRRAAAHRVREERFCFLGLWQTPMSLRVFSTLPPAAPFRPPSQPASSPTAGSGAASVSVPAGSEAHGLFHNPIPTAVRQPAWRFCKVCSPRALLTVRWLDPVEFHSLQFIHLPFLGMGAKVVSGAATPTRVHVLLHYHYSRCDSPTTDTGTTAWLPGSSRP